MTPARSWAEGLQRHLAFRTFLVVLVPLFIGMAAGTSEALPIYESAPNGPLATLGSPLPYGDLPPVVVSNQTLGVKFFVSAPVTTGSVGGYFGPYGSVESDIVGAIVRLSGPYDFPNSYDLTTKDVLGTTNIHISKEAGNYAGDLSVTLMGGWYALVFAATGTSDANNAIMPRMVSDIADPLYFFGRTTADVGLSACSSRHGAHGLRSTKKHRGHRSHCGPGWGSTGFEYLSGGGLGGIRMFVNSDPATPVPEPSTLLLLGSGLAGLGGVAWRRYR